MAKKQTMNFFEANFEKFVLGVAVIFFGWIFYANFINAPGVDIGRQKVSAVDAATEAKQRANATISDMHDPIDTNELEGYKPTGDLLSLVQPTEMQEIPLSPPDITKLILEQDVRNYTLPAKPILTEPMISLTHAMAQIPVVDTTNTQQNINQDFVNTRVNQAASEIKDITFVSVEATINMESYYNEFETAFTGPGIEKKLTEFYQPIVATVQLLRRELQDDGSWSDPVTVPRMAIDPLKDSLSASDMKTLTKARHGVAMKDNSSASIQQMLLQPEPYELIGKKWLNPSSAVLQTDVNNDPRMIANQDNYRMNNMRGMGNNTLIDKALKIWAHDDSVKPGKIYKYAVRVGFFNPCFETNWLNHSQENMKEEPVLWSKIAEPDNYVPIPPQVLFVPKSITSSDNARVEIYKYQNGQWFKRPFTVTPGAKIGYPADQPALSTNTGIIAGNTAQTAGNENMAAPADAGELVDIEVDFGMDATVLEIKAPTIRWYDNNGKLQSQETGEIVYSDRDGVVHSLTTSNAFWPDSFKEMQTSVNKAYTADEKKRKDMSRNQRNR